MKKNLFLAGMIAIAGAGCATAKSQPEMSEKAASRLAQFEKTGETRSCLSITQIRSMDALDDYHFLVETNNGDYYLNSLSNRCSGASRTGSYIQYKMSGSQLCRGQIVTVVDNMADMTVGSCGLNDFEKLEEAPTEEN